MILFRSFGALRKCLVASYTVTHAAKKAVYEAAHPLHPSVRVRELVSHGGAARGAAAAAAACASSTRSASVPCAASRGSTHVGAAHQLGGAIAAARAGHRGLLHRAAAAALAVGHVSRMDWDRLPRRMLSAWVPHRGGRWARHGSTPTAVVWPRRCTSSTLTVYALAGARCRACAGWRTMLQSGEAPSPSRQPPEPELPMPIFHPLVRHRRAAAVKPNAAIP